MSYKNREVAIRKLDDGLSLSSPNFNNFLDDKEIVLHAISKKGDSLRFASDELKNDKEVVIEAVKKSGYAFRFASEELRDNKELVVDLIKIDNNTIGWMSERLLNDKEIQVEMLKVRPDLFNTYKCFDELKQRIGDKDPIKALESEILAEKLQNQLSSKQELKPTKKIKI